MKNSVGKRLTLAFLVCMAVFMILACVVGYFESRTEEQKICSNYLKYFASFVADSMKEVSVQELLEDAAGSQETPGRENRKGIFHAIERELEKFRACMNLEYVYVYIPAEDGKSLTSVYMLGEGGEEIWEPGEKVYEEYAPEVLDVYHGEIPFAQKITNNKYGYVTTVYCPVYGPDGEIQAVAGVDMERTSLVSAFLDKMKGTFAIIITGCIMAVLVLLILSRKLIIRPLEQLTASMESFVSTRKESGSFMRIQIESGDEFGRISEVFNSMAEDTERYIGQLQDMTATEEKRRTELEVAREIQEKSLPDGKNPFKEDKRFQLSASMNAAWRVGGDFYDFFFVHDDSLCVAVGDVSGKGISAALLMMRARTLLKENVLRGESLAEVLKRVNIELCEGNETGMFVTVFLGILDLHRGLFRYANAGHNPPYVGRKEYHAMQLARTCPLGCFDDESYEEESIQMNAGEGVFLYTDGVTEAKSVSGHFFGADRMKQVLDENAERDCFHIIGSMEKEIGKFSENEQQFDDITMLMLRFLAGSDYLETLTVKADIQNLEQVRGIVDRTVGEKCPGLLQLQLAAEEIFVNIASYAYGEQEAESDEEKSEEEMPVRKNTLEREIAEITCSRSGKWFSMTMKDYGKPFNVLEHAEPEWKESIDEQEPGGFGISLVRKVMDEVSYRREGGANILTMGKELE